MYSTYQLGSWNTYLHYNTWNMLWSSLAYIIIYYCIQQTLYTVHVLTSVSVVCFTNMPSLLRTTFVQHTVAKSLKTQFYNAKQVVNKQRSGSFFNWNNETLLEIDELFASSFKHLLQYAVGQFPRITAILRHQLQVYYSAHTANTVDFKMWNSLTQNTT